MKVMLAEFATPEAMLAAAHRARAEGAVLVDAFTPFPVDGLYEVLPAYDRGIRLSMLLSGMVAAGVGYALQWWTIAINYPLNTGGRPFNSWPVFLMFPMEVGMLVAAVAGVILFFLRGGLPALHAPIFDCEIIRRAGISGFFIALREPHEEGVRSQLRQRLIVLGATSTHEAEI